MSAYPHEQYPTPPAPSPYSRIAAVVGDGYYNLSHSPSVEQMYLDYQVQTRDEELGNRSKVIRINQLPAREQSQVDRLVDLVTDSTGMNRDILQARADRVGVLIVDEHTKNGEYVGGEFDVYSGLATVAVTPHPTWTNHGKMHEITHGLLSSGSIYCHNGRALCTGNGVLVGRTMAGELMDDLAVANGLRKVNEAIIDSYALMVSDLDTQGYLDGDYGIGDYPNWVRTFLALRKKDPYLVNEMLQAAFRESTADLAQARRFVSAFEDVERSAVLQIPRAKRKKTSLSRGLSS